MLIIVMGLFFCGGCSTVEDLSNTGKETISPPTVELSSGILEIGGVVLGGGDQTPEGLLDAPRVFIYQVRLDSGEEIAVTYTAVPPSPGGRRSNFTLAFNDGMINPGNYLKARGTYDQSTKTLTIANEGDFIQTFAQKP